MAVVLDFVVQRSRSRRWLALAPLLVLACGRHANVGTPDGGDSNGSLDTRASGGFGGFNGFGGYPGSIGGYPGSVDASAGGSGGALGCVVALDCAGLPHVRTGVDVPCVNGHCVPPSGSCEHGFDHCTLNARSGCETDLSTPDNCGQCNFRCFDPQGICMPANGTFYCGATCGGPDLPASCGMYCANLDNDPANCGACGRECFVPNMLVECDRGTCLTDGCIDSSWADCTDAPGCETPLGTATDCGRCDDPACTIANTLFSCSDGLGCAAGVCAPGYANCNQTSPDCESAFASTASASCLPHYQGTTVIATGLFENALTAIAPDGSFFLAGRFMGPVDFDPTAAGHDVRTADTDADGYITKLNADGSYAWTATLVGRGDIVLQALLATPTGGVTVSGFYQDTVDLDPGPATDLHTAVTTYATEPFVVQLAANGTLVWSRTFAGITPDANGTASALTMDTTGGVYVGGYFTGTVDFESGPASDTFTATADTGYVVKLAANGGYVWTHPFDNAPCNAYVNGVALDGKGDVWVAGTAAHFGACTLVSPVIPTPRAAQDGLFVAQLTPGGVLASNGILGGTVPSNATAFAIGPDGSMYLAGQGTGVDPKGIGRWLGIDGTSFIAKLNSLGFSVWASPITGPTITSIAATADGGVLAAGSDALGSAFVTRFTSGGDSVWSFDFGGQATMGLSVSTTGTTFVVGGTSSGSEDFDPGPAIDPIFGDVSFVARYTF